MCKVLSEKVFDMGRIMLDQWESGKAFSLGVNLRKKYQSFSSGSCVDTDSDYRKYPP